MKTIIMYLTSLFFGLLLLDSTVCKGQNNSLNMSNDKEIGIEILEKNFNYQVGTCINIMKSNDTIRIQEYIDMARIYNTLEVRNLINEQESYKVFMKLFTSKYLELAAKHLEAKLTKGMCYYSKKYDLYIGGKPHKNSMYKIAE